MGFKMRIIFLLIFLTCKTFVDINIMKCCSEMDYLNRNGLCTRAENEKDKNGFRDFMTQIIPNHKNWTTTVFHNFSSSLTSDHEI